MFDLVRTVEELVHRSGGPSASEDGIGLVEMMVAILVIGFILTALGTSLVVTLRTVQGNETLVQATAVHQQSLEQVVSLPYEVIGIYENDADYRATLTDDGDTYTTVGIPPVSSPEVPDSRVPEAVRTVTRDSRTFEVRTDIYMVDTDGVGGVDAKRIRTTVSWQEGGDTRSTTAYALRTPVADELPSPFTVILYEPSPNIVQLDSSGGIDQAVQISVHFNQPAGSGTVTAPLADGTSYTTNLSTPNADMTEWTVTIPMGTEMPVGDQSIELDATSADGTQGETATLTVTVLDESASGPSDSFAIKDIETNLAPLEYNNSSKERCSFVVDVRVTGFLPHVSGEPAPDRVDVTYQYLDSSQGNADLQTSSRLTATYVSNDGLHGRFRLTVPASSSEYFRSNTSVTITAFAQPADSTEQDVDSITRNATGVGSC